jgi:hypothetical protein
VGGGGSGVSAGVNRRQPEKSSNSSRDRGSKNCLRFMFITSLV